MAIVDAKTANLPVKLTACKSPNDEWVLLSTMDASCFETVSRQNNYDITKNRFWCCRALANKLELRNQ